MTEKNSDGYEQRISDLLEEGDELISNLDEILEDSHELAENYGRQGLDYTISCLERKHIERLINEWENISDSLRKIQDEMSGEK